MIKKVLFQKRKIIFTLLISVTAIFFAIHYSKECSNGIIKGLSFCIQVLLPSLFLYMVIASYIVRNGVADLICKPFGKLTGFLFKIPPVGLVPVTLSLIGGYPIGAKCINTMYEKNILTENQAEKCAYIAVAAGPGFLINYMGYALLNNKSAGNILLISQTTALIITGIIVSRIVKCDTCSNKATRSYGEKNIFVNSVKDGSTGALSMCAMVVVFSALIEITDSVIKNETLKDIICAFLEITTGCNRMCGKYPLYVVAFFVGFSGLCVHFQIFAALKFVNIKKIKFIAFRFISGIIMLAITYILLKVMPQYAATFSTVQDYKNAATSTTIWGASALLICAVCFLSSVNFSENKRRKNQCAE